MCRCTWEVATRCIPQCVHDLYSYSTVCYICNSPSEEDHTTHDIARVISRQIVTRKAYLAACMCFICWYNIHHTQVIRPLSRGIVDTIRRVWGSRYSTSAIAQQTSMYWLIPVLEAPFLKNGVTILRDSTQTTNIILHKNQQLLAFSLSMYLFFYGM